MAQRVESWVSDTGKRCATEHEARRDDLALWFTVNTHLGDKEAVVLVAKMTNSGNFERFADMCRALAICLPGTDEGGTPPADDMRPAECRFRLMDEGTKPYPRSACNACGKTISTGLGVECQYKTGDPPHMLRS